MKTIEQAIQAAGEIADGIYLRWSEAEHEVGEILSPSVVWVRGEPTAETLPGTCAIDPHIRLSRLDRSTAYSGKVYLVTGRVVGQGEDPGEVIIEECVVVAEL